MTDPVDTDALRDLQALNGGILSRNLLRGSGVWKMNRDVTEALGAAADEMDRLRHVRDAWKSSTEDNFRKYQHLRAVIENAPHPIECKRGNSGNTRVPCTCWKAAAL